MAAPGLRPPPDPWTVGIHASPDGAGIIGAGVVVDATHVLTAAHVVHNGQTWRDPLWVSFPKAEGVPFGLRCRVQRCEPAQRAAAADVAVLVLECPVPRQVTPARLKYPVAGDLFDGRFWAFGFPDGAVFGDQVRGRLGVGLGHGGIMLHRDEGTPVLPGHSGAGLWSYRYGAVVGLVIQGAPATGDGHAVTLAYVDQQLPELKIRVLAAWIFADAGPFAHAAWGWELVTDPERGQHWEPRSRGAAAADDREDRFRGRRAALTEIVTWLDRPAADHRVLVVTGSPGVGKSAVLARIITTADEAVRAQLPPDDAAVKATPRSVSCAVHAKGKTALEVAQEIAVAASLPTPVEPRDVVVALRIRLNEQDRRFNLVLDALDEAAGPGQARAIVTEILRPLAGITAPAGAQVVVGTRRRDAAGGDLLGTFNGAAHVIDLDVDQYFEPADLRAYALSTLTYRAPDRPTNPYLDRAVARPVAHRIAELAGHNFLIAGLVARARALSDWVPAEPAEIRFDSTVDAAVDSYLERLSLDGSDAARLAFTVLAYAEAPGITVELWRDGINALGGSITAGELTQLARGSAANYLVEGSAGPAEPVYRLFHQSLNDALRRARADERGDENRLLDAWLRHLDRVGWERAPDYLRRSLAGHAARCGRIDELLADEEALLHADLRRLRAAAESAVSPRGRARARLLQRTPRAVLAGPAERAALFSVTSRVDRIEGELRGRPDAPYLAQWANTPAGLEHAVFDGHPDAVLGVCALSVGGGPALAAAGADATVRIWDAVTGDPVQILVGHTDRVRAVCPVTVDGQIRLASAGDDGTIAIWDPESGQRLHVLSGHSDWVRGLATFPQGPRTVLASTGDDRSVRLWDPGTGGQLSILSGLSSAGTAITAYPAHDGQVVVTGTYDGRIRLWPADGRPGSSLAGHDAWVTAVAPCLVDGQTRLASAGYDGSVRVWDLATGEPLRQWDLGGGPVTALTMVRAGQRDLIVATAEDGQIRWRDPDRPGWQRSLPGHARFATSACTIHRGQRSLVASGGEDGTIRLWDALTHEPVDLLDGGRTGPVSTLCAVTVDDRELLASTTEFGLVQLWQPATGDAAGSLSGHFGPVTGLCAVPLDDRTALCSSGADHKVILWDPLSREETGHFAGTGDGAAALCHVEVAGEDLVAGVGDDQTVRLWHAASRTLRRELHGHTEWVRGVCAVPGRSGPLLLSASHDGSVRIWDPGTGGFVRALTGHTGGVLDVAHIPLPRKVMAASAGADKLVRLWNVTTGEAGPVLAGHDAEVTGVCAVRVPGGHLVASSSLDRTVRLWDPVTGAQLWCVSVQHPALTCRFVAGRLVVGLSNGILALEVRHAAPRRVT